MSANSALLAVSKRSTSNVSVSSMRRITYACNRTCDITLRPILYYEIKSEKI